MKVMRCNETDSHSDRQMMREADRPTDVQVHREVKREKHTQTGEKIDREIGVSIPACELSSRAALIRYDDAECALILILEKQVVSNQGR